MVCVFVWPGENYSNTQWRISVKYAVHELIGIRVDVARVSFLI